MICRVGLAALPLLLLVAPHASGEIYRWEDEQGRPHFSDRVEDVPAGFRRDVTAGLRGDGEAALPEPGAPEETAPSPTASAPAAPAASAAGRAQAEALAKQLSGLASLGVGGVLVLALAVLALSFACYAGLLKLACRLCGEAPLAFGRALLVALVQMVAGIGIGLVELLLVGASGVESGGAGFQGVQALLGLAVNAGVLQALGVCERFFRAVLVMVVVTAITVVISLPIALVLILVLGHAAGLG